MNSRTVTIRARVARRGVGDHTVLVFPSGEMFVKEFDGGRPLFVESHRAGLTDAARSRAWEASGFKRGGK